jgi:GNAT superfamily N-acetyltransferase
MAPTLRLATRQDIPGIQEVRHAVIENAARPGRILDEDVRREIEETGRGWLIEEAGAVRAFAIANAQTGNVWALFVHPGAQGRGYGARLHDELLAWLAGQPPRRLWLTTGAQTRASGFYARRGWQPVATLPDGEIRYERDNGMA